MRQCKGRCGHSISPIDALVCHFAENEWQIRQGKGQCQCSYLLSPINTMVRHLAENALANAKYSVVVLHHEYFALSLCGE